MERLAVWSFATAAAFAMACAGAAGQELQEPKVEHLKPGELTFEQLEKLFDPAPAEILDSFIKAWKATDEFKLAEAMKTDRIKPLVDSWQQTLGLPMAIVTSNHLHDRFQEVKSVGCRMYIDRTGASDRAGRNAIFFSLVRIGDGKAVRYRVDRSRLADLDFDILDHLRVYHPMTKVIEEFQATRETLSEIVNRVFKLGSINLDSKDGCDYSINADADRITLNMKVRKCTLVHVLELAARAAGWRIGVDDGTPDSQFDYDCVSSGDAANCREDLARQKATAAEREGSGLPSIQECLRLLVFKAAAEMKSRKHCIIVSPDRGR